MQKQYTENNNNNNNEINTQNQQMRTQDGKSMCIYLNGVNSKSADTFLTQTKTIRNGIVSSKRNNNSIELLID